MYIHWLLQIQQIDNLKSKRFDKVGSYLKSKFSGNSNLKRKYNIYYECACVEEGRPVFDSDSKAKFHITTSIFHDNFYIFLNISSHIVVSYQNQTCTVYFKGNITKNNQVSNGAMRMRRTEKPPFLGEKNTDFCTFFTHTFLKL